MSVEISEWLIRKGGYYYRPNRAGYTTSKFEAGRYTKAEAEREAAVEPWHMKAIHQDDVEDDPVSSRVRMDGDRIAELEAENERLKQEYEHPSGDFVHYADHVSALAAKDAELATVHQRYVDANEARIDAEAQLAEIRKALVIANAQLDNMEFLSVEGFMDWQQEYRVARRVREGGEANG